MPPSNISLKQRLATLSLSPSSPTSPNGPSSAPPLRSTFAAKRRALFTPPWSSKRQPGGVLPPEMRDIEVVQEVMTRLIFQAGVDFETRPMVIISASALPDPREVSYDLLLSRIMSYLNLYVESDYTVVFFAAGGKHTPGWNWVWKAYRSLSRKYRKNLKRLFIVHTSFFSKMLFSLAGAIISPKFFRKIVYIPTLSELAQHIPLTQIDISPAVYQENLKYEKKIVLPVPSRSSIFGVPLEDLMGYDGEKGTIPRVVKDSIQFLRETGLNEEGLFRRSPQSVMLKAAQEAYDRGNVVSLQTFGDPHLAAVLLKKYLRDLPQPVFPESLYPLIRRCPAPSSDPSDMSAVAYLREILLPELIPCVYMVLSHVLHLMHEISLRSASNLMDAHNLSLVLSPNLVKGSNLILDVKMCTIPDGPNFFDSTMSLPTAPRSNPAVLAEGKTTLGMIIKLCIQRYYEIFDEIRDRSEAVAPQRAFRTEDNGASSPSSSSKSPSPSPQPTPMPQSDGDDDEDIDDAMLVMPIGPGNISGSSGGGGSSVGLNGGASPPSAWNSPGFLNGQTGNSTFKPRHRNNLSGSSRVRSMHTIANDGTSGVIGGSSAGNSSGGGSGLYPHMTTGKSKSMISVDSGTVTGKRGSISVGRGTRKSAGAAVEALSITAEGFFTAPASAPPVPTSPLLVKAKQRQQQDGDA
ncbi:Rho GTPase activation protein [Pluteus cervinus]|uniref:Rho GTPase activation protein n=1 Tax=Pluteus cervinus TaxID=181527 RepID=A0ACD3B3T5_9AGAR|nr:Rho GTPase activation protein [Pluteus cervinus]